ncbi:saccharopine dehydrogenase C-terminal domain-containing protein [Sporosarcina sp. 179-K 8C2 HS]|uniref:saccharopine dehydrogenase family protein n=1 Tax=Sporosarcina sp. 179-K 8C2 HS TaxID=3142387 RepID=UPI0039A0E857
MHVVVLGAGMIGTTVVREVSHFAEITKVTVVDVRKEGIDKCLETAKSTKVQGQTAALATEEDIAAVLSNADLAIACLPHSLSLTAIKAAITSRCHLVDLVGSNFTEKNALSQQAMEAGIIIVPGCGVAPGITNFLAAQGIELLDEAEEAVMICGGIPRHPIPPLWYQVVFRLESVLGLYTKPALAIKNGEIVKLPPLTGLEKISFPEPVGECEMVNTDAHSTAFTLKDKVKNLYEKTVRYPGHWEKMKVLAELGFLDSEPIMFDGHPIVPRTFTESVLSPKLIGPSIEDITVVRVEVKGIKKGVPTKHSWELVDFYDHGRGITSMAKTTALPATVAAKWILQGKINETGIMPLENLIINERFQPFVDELNELGIQIKYNAVVESPA